MKRVKAIAVLLFLAAGAFFFWRGSDPLLPDLTEPEQRAVNALVEAYLDDRLDAVTEGQVAAAAAIGDRAVPHLVQALDQERGGRPAERKSDLAPLIACLARIGSPQAVDGICRILVHDHARDHLHQDRKVAAAALVLLGARDRAPLLGRVIAHQDELASQAPPQSPPSPDAATLDYLNRALAALEAGQGKAEPRGLCWTTGPDGQRTRGFQDPLEALDKPPEQEGPAQQEDGAPLKGS